MAELNYGMWLQVINLTSLDGHTVSVKDLKFSPDNKTLMSVGGGNILLWDWDTVLKSARGKEAENTSEQILPTAAEPTENVLQFVENSSHFLIFLWQKPQIMYCGRVRYIWQTNGLMWHLKNLPNT